MQSPSGIMKIHEWEDMGRRVTVFHKFLHHTHAIYNRPFRYKLVLEGILSGAFAGLTAIALRLLLSRADSLRAQAIDWVAARPAWSFLMFLFLLGIAALVTLLLKWEPYISGSGIPQLEAEMEGHIEQKWWRVLLAKFLGSTLAIGAGLSLGREGPSIQLGAMAGKGTAEITRDREDSRLIMTFGACAGLSAAFNAPFAGVLFALEEVQKRFSADVLVSAMAASIAANLLSVALVGAAPVFDLGTVSVMPLSHLWLMPLLGVFLGCIGALYNRCIALSQNLYAHVRNRYLRTAIPFVLAGVLALTAPEVLGSGHELVAETGAGLAIGTLLFLLAAKFLFSMASFGSGVPGGIFLPLLVLGALSGGIFAYGAQSIGISSAYLANFVILGMAGIFAAIVRAPITGIILICEMTGSFSQFLNISLVALCAYLMADALRAQPIYEQLLARMLSGQKR